MGSSIYIYMYNIIIITICFLYIHSFIHSCIHSSIYLFNFVYSHPTFCFPSPPFRGRWGPPFGSPDDAVAADSPEDLAAEVPELPGETLNASACPQAGDF